MGHNKKEQNTETDQNWNSHTRPPDWALPSFKDSVSEADRIYNDRKGSDMPALSNGTTGAINGLNGMPGAWGGNTSSENNLQNWANGSMVGNNPQFQAALQNQLDNVANTVNSQIAGAGRSGSGANTSILGNELGNVATQAYANQYNQDVNNMFKANGMLDQDQLAKLQGQQGAWNDALKGNEVQDKWNQANDQRGWDELGRWQNAIEAGTGGASDSWGSGHSTSNTTQTGSNNPWKIAGGIAETALAGKSDERLKENIKLVGEKRGHNWYEFNYKSNPAKRYRGVMAQEVAKIRPDAVFIDPKDGYFLVDYGLLGLKMEEIE